MPSATATRHQIPQLLYVSGQQTSGLQDIFGQQQSVARESIPTTATTLKVGNYNFDDSQTVVSISEYAPTARGISHDRVVVPQPPRLPPTEKYFECPYCFIVCSRKYTEPKAWRSHILRDLQPYLCTYEICNQADKLFTTRKEWKAHEEELHRKLWRCLEHPDQTFFSSQAYRNHIQAEHIRDATAMQSSVLFRAGESTSTIADRSCPICGGTFQLAEDLQDHVAAHLERIAVFALPRSTTAVEDEGEEDTDSDAAVQILSNESAETSSSGIGSDGLESPKHADDQLSASDQGGQVLSIEKIGMLEQQLPSISPDGRSMVIDQWMQENVQEVPERPTWIRIKRKYIRPDSLNAHRLNWEHDLDDIGYIIIKGYVDHELQRELFEDTRKRNQSEWRKRRTLSAATNDSQNSAADTAEDHSGDERPTWIRIALKHILPAILDAYDLNWEYDRDNNEYVIIKEYVDHELQRDLFAHSKSIMHSGTMEALQLEQVAKTSKTGEGDKTRFTEAAKEVSKGLKERVRIPKRLSEPELDTHSNNDEIDHGANSTIGYVTQGIPARYIRAEVLNRYIKSLPEQFGKSCAIEYRNERYRLTIKRRLTVNEIVDMQNQSFGPGAFDWE